MTATVYEYPVRRPFDYGDEHFEAGDWWSPAGYRNDANIREYYVDKSQARIKVDNETPEAPKAKRPAKPKPRREAMAT